MQWLTPLVGLYAAAAAVPLLLLLYFLKLKRREVTVSSTLLWKRAVQDLQVNAPFQRLRRNLLLLIQLLAILAILLALAGPVMTLSRGPGQRYVVLIDRSASMNATDVGPTRLDEAKRQARVFVESMRSGSVFSLRDGADHAMIIAFDRHAKVMCNFTSDVRQLSAAIDAIEPTDGVSHVGEAITIARAFAQAPGAEPGTRTTENAAKLVLFSDGRIDDADTIAVTSDELIFHCIGQAKDNVAITAMKARRRYEQPDEVEIFASLVNYGDKAVTRDVQLGINGDVRSVRSVTLPAASAGSEDTPAEPGKTSVNFSLSHTGAGVVEVRQVGDDVLACDNAAWSILEAPKRLSVLLVTQGNPILEMALRACPIAKLDPCTPAGFDAMDPALFNAADSYDVVVLDNHVPAQLPRCRYLAFGAIPEGIDVNSPGLVEDQIIVDWRSRHPVMQYVNLTNLFATQTWAMDLPRDAEVLAEFNNAPAVAMLHRHGSTFLLVGFNVLESNWPFEPGFVLFCYNALNYLAVQMNGADEFELNVTEPIVVENLRSEEPVTVTGPEMSDVQVRPDAGRSVRFSGTHRAGVYGLEVPDEPSQFYAVNLLSAAESRIEPREEIAFSGAQVASQEEEVQRANVPLWPVLILIALGLVCIEWLIYNLRVRV